MQHIVLSDLINLFLFFTHVMYYNTFFNVIIKFMNPIEEYYGKFNEEKRFDSRHGQVEYRVTMKYIKEFIKATGKAAEQISIIDIGAGTGRYAVPLVNEG